MNHPLLFTIVAVVGALAFAWSCFVRFRLVTIGKNATRTDGFIGRLWFMIEYAFGQRKVVSRPFGWNHCVLFWCFLVLALANGDFIVAGIVPSISLSRLPSPLYHLLIGAFDIVSLVTLFAVGLAFSRRLFFPPKYIEARSRDAFIILSLVAALMLAFFATHAFELLASGDAAEARFRPLSAAVAGLFNAMPAEQAETLAMVFWWIHAVILLSFLNYLPYSKHMHILTAIPNCFLRNRNQANTLPVEEFKEGNSFGIGTIAGFTWKDLFDAYSCTECGRCQDMCPATNTDKPLNPRLFIHELKVNLLKNGPALLAGKSGVQPLIGEGGNGSISEETIWSCTSCGACMEVCPVFIEQMPKILQLRRDCVEMRAKMPEELITFFENSEQRSNPWGIAPGERVKWHAHINAKPFEPGMEYLFYVGCAGSFDARGKQVSVALATIFDAAGISWGILGKDEKCCGDSLRRLGNEYVFDRMARENIELLKSKGVQRIVTACPHCFSTLGNDYRQFGFNGEVVHYTQVIDRLIREGKLPLSAKDGLGRTMLHDSCYLARHNNVVKEPRSIFSAATGTDPQETSRSRKNTFCCGAGGGRMWMEENAGTRINTERTREFVDNKAETICVCCPYCLTMMEDGLKDLHAEERVVVKDLAEIVAERLTGRPAA